MTDQKVMESFCELINMPGHLVEIGVGKPGLGRFERAFYYDEITPDILKSFAKSPNSHSFLPGVRTLHVDKKTKKESIRTTRQLCARTGSAEDISSRSIMSFDIDIKDLQAIPKKMSASEIRRVVYDYHSKIFSEMNKVVPIWMAVFSGYGVHYHVKFDCPVDCSNKSKYKKKYFSILNAFKSGVSGVRVQFDESCNNIARAMRLPYSVNWKNKDRPIKTEVWHHNEKASGDGFLANPPSNRCEKQSYDLKLIKDNLTFNSLTQHFGYNKTSSISMSGDEIKFSSPWNSDSEPSCYFNKKDKTFYDFSSGKGGDALTFVAEMMGLNTTTDFPKVVKEAAQIAGVAAVINLEQRKQQERVESRSGVSESDEAKYSHYKEFFKKHLGEYGKDIISKKLMYKDPSGNWQSVWLLEDLLKSHAADNYPWMKVSYVKPHLARFSAEKEHEEKLLVPIEKWDGVDRIKEISKCLTFTDERMTSKIFEDHLKLWGSRMLQRMKDPKVQNCIFLLTGGQGIGKDTLIANLLDGLGQFWSDFTFHPNNDRDNYIQITEYICLNFSEFDSVGARNQATIKRLITKNQANVRKPYGKDFEKRDVRCSFIGSSNISDLLTDSTGNRRYVLFDIDKIDFSYPKAPAQILAQWKYLSDTIFEMDEESKRFMDDHINDLTPLSFDEEVLEMYSNHMKTTQYHKERITDDDIFPFLERMRIALGLKSQQNIRKVLNKAKLTNRTNNIRYFLREPKK